MFDSFASSLAIAVGACLGIAGAAGCFDPTYPVGQACSESQQCPPGQDCREGVCRLEVGPLPIDAARDDIDAAPVPAVPVLSVAVGWRHTCAVLDGGGVMCWGEGDDGRLGYGDTRDVGAEPGHLPRHAGLVSVGGAVTEVALGERHTCALLEGGTVRCWGSNDVGQLGTGIVGDVIGDDELPSTRAPVALQGAARAIAAYRNHTCAVMADNLRIYCWGEGGPHLGAVSVSGGHIGDDETPEEAGPLSLPGEIQAVDVGNYHTCAMLAPGQLHCWGLGAHGRLGYLDTQDIGTVPAEAIEFKAATTRVSIGGAHGCVQLTGGDVFCWGRGEHGRLGVGSIADVGDEAGDIFAPTPTGGTVTGFSAGGSHTCAILDPGELRCWGNFSRGRLGNDQIAVNIGDNEPASDGPVSPVVEVDRGERITGVAAGPNHTCIVVEGGPVGALPRVRCFGVGDSGALGYGATDDIGDDETVVMVGDVPMF